MKILSFEAGTEITSEMLSERYYDYIARNSPEKEGSVYLTAKIDNAKEALIAHYGLTLLEQAADKKTEPKSPEDDAKKAASESKKDFEGEQKQEPKN